MLGWARYRSRFVKRAPDVDIYLDGQLLGRVTANRPQYAHCSYNEDPEEHCCFQFELPAVAIPPLLLLPKLLWPPATEMLFE